MRYLCKRFNRLDLLGNTIAEQVYFDLYIGKNKRNILQKF